MSNEPPSIQEIVNWFVCPVCRGPLAAKDQSAVCASCGRRYPIQDDIPVLLEGRASQA